MDSQIIEIAYGVKVLYEDNHIIVAIKPAGVLSQSDGSNAPDMLTILKAYIKEKYQKPGEVYLGLVHRLDRPVGGIMVYARNEKAASRLSDELDTANFKKYYQAVLKGELSDDSGDLTDYLLKDGRTNITKVVTKDTKGAKKAKLFYELLDEFETNEGILSYVLIELFTGRHHQIRAQFASRKAPVYGDTKYDPSYKGKKMKQIALFATRLEFDHPATGDHLVFKREPEGPAFDVIDVDEW